MYAVCVYAGTQTKISLNSKITKNKFSSIERSLNKYKAQKLTLAFIFFFFIFLHRYLILFVLILLIEMIVRFDISQENKSDIIVNFSTVFSFTLDYEYFKGTDLYLFR